MKKYLLFCLWVLFSKPLWADDLNFAVSKITEELKTDAYAVIRHDELIFEVKSVGKSVEKVRYAITILDKEGDDYAHLVVPYDKFNKVVNLKGRIYNSLGEEVRKLKKSDISDISLVSGVTIMSDSRAKVVEVSLGQYPFTVEYEYEVASEQSLFYPQFRPLPSSKVATQGGIFKVITPDKIPLRFKSYNLELEPEIFSLEGKNTYTWKIGEMPVFKSEPYAPGLSEVLPTIITGPKDFQMEGFQGNMSDWLSFGQWINQLNQGRGELPKHIIKEVNELVTDLPDLESKVRAVYEYMQNQTRYVSIQLGIGGFQPFEASFVAEKGYGDCKALSNYTQALLKAVGISSNQVLIWGGANRPIRTDFPSSQFNHMILSVPSPNDTIWLECTSQTNPFGYQGYFTGDRDALMITDEGGKIVHTTVYPLEANTQFRRAEVYISNTGDASASIRTDFSGLQYENVDWYLNQSMELQKKELYEDLEINNATIESFKHSQEKNRIPKARQDLKLKIRKLASLSGKRLFITPNLMNQSGKAPRAIKDRKYEVLINTGFYDADTISFHFPEGFQPEYLPKAKEFISDFGHYRAEILIEGKEMTYIRTLKMFKGRHPKEKYTELRSFLKDVYKADKLKLVLVEKKRENATTNSDGGEKI
ncbi:DUF3857 domain-containing protein [Xanthovirga aplysinae]|uniref:DUF3857 domain-containing protein n=1 Tax=Xanthovirga aplysinae TaxID=2529853 RepID=UPI0012BD10E7|nr:DUF3857 domain-containing protein [Xanthovirga aplysinae]MTI30311.1 DUF3857 domain-containing protein [Xanthovirga aplysinae]